MKTVQQMMNHNVTGEKPQPATNEMIKVEIQMPADNIDDEVEDNNNAEADIDQLRRSTRSNKGIPAKRLSLLVQNEVKIEPASWNEMKLLPNDEQKNGIQAAEEEIHSHDENKLGYYVISLQRRK